MNNYERRPYTFDRVVRILFSVCALLATLYLLSILKGVLLPFLVASLIAYMLEPVTVLEMNADIPLIPASIMKCVTTATLLSRLDEDARFHTEVYAAGTVRDGILDGNLIIVGSGDPSLNSRHVEGNKLRRRIGDGAFAAVCHGIRAQQSLGILVVASHHAGTHYLVKRNRFMIKNEFALPLTHRLTLHYNSVTLKSRLQTRVKNSSRI